MIIPAIRQSGRAGPALTVAAVDVSRGQIVFDGSGYQLPCYRRRRWIDQGLPRRKLRRLVRGRLKLHDYRPDKTEQAVETVLGRAELLAAEWAE